MIYWNPSLPTVQSYEPVAGWNRSFSESDKMKSTNLFFFLCNKKGFSKKSAEILSQMIVFKEKYNDLQYSEEQEQFIANSLKPVFH